MNHFVWFLQSIKLIIEVSADPPPHLGVINPRIPFVSLAQVANCRCKWWNFGGQLKSNLQSLEVKTLTNFSAKMSNSSGFPLLKWQACNLVTKFPLWFSYPASWLFAAITRVYCLHNQVQATKFICHDIYSPLLSPHIISHKHTHNCIAIAPCSRILDPNLNCQWEFKSGWYLARCGSTIVLEMSRRPEPIIPPLLRQMDLKLTASCADFKLELKIFCSYLFMKFCGCEARTFDQSVTIDQSLGGCYAK